MLTEHYEAQTCLGAREASIASRTACVISCPRHEQPRSVRMLSTGVEDAEATQPNGKVEMFLLRKRAISPPARKSTPGNRLCGVDLKYEEGILQDWLPQQCPSEVVHITSSAFHTSFLCCAPLQRCHCIDYKHGA